MLSLVSNIPSNPPHLCIYFVSYKWVWGTAQPLFLLCNHDPRPKTGFDYIWIPFILLGLVLWSLVPSKGLLSHFWGHLNCFGVLRSLGGTSDHKVCSRSPLLVGVRVCICLCILPCGRCLHDGLQGLKCLSSLSSSSFVVYVFQSFFLLFGFGKGPSHLTPFLACILFWVWGGLEGLGFGPPHLT